MEVAATSAVKFKFPVPDWVMVGPLLPWLNLTTRFVVVAVPV
jgi:hypothetical protein